MTRHRSPAAGAPDAAATVDVRRLLAGAGVPLPPSRRCALKRGATAAAVTGAALAVAAPAASLLPTDTAGSATTASASAQIGLTASDVRGDSAAGSAAGDLVLADGARIVASVLPVGRAVEPTAPADNLLKSATLNEAAAVRLAREARMNCDVGLGGLGAVKSHVRDAARFLACLYDRPDLIGVASRSRVSDHATGLALDLMTRGEKGDRIAACALANREALGISYVIWEQRINFGTGWQRMENRGSDTENHVDHVHVSFERGAGTGDPDPDLCT